MTEMPEWISNCLPTKMLLYEIIFPFSTLQILLQNPIHVTVDEFLVSKYKHGAVY